MTKLFYGFRFYSGKNTTIDSPNKITGRHSIAGEAAVFKSKQELCDWLAKEKLSSPCGLGGGERISVTKKELRKLQLGISVDDFEELLKMMLRGGTN